MKQLISIISLYFLISNVQASVVEVLCKGASGWEFIIEQNADFREGSLVFRNNILERVALTKKSVRRPEYEKLKSLYQGATSEDSYSLFIFKETENKGYISFLEIESLLGHKKVIEFRCRYNL